MTTDITELAQPEINDALVQLKQLSEYPTPSTQYARVLRKYIASLTEALEHYKSREDRVTALVHDNSKSWDDLYRQVEEKGKRNAELVEALEKAQRANNSAPAILRQLAEEKQKRGEVAAATAFNYAASALQKELSK